MKNLSVMQKVKHPKYGIFTIIAGRVNTVTGEYSYDIMQKKGEVWLLTEDQLNRGVFTVVK